MSRPILFRTPARTLARPARSRVQQGFSLIEVMVVVVIMGIMAALVVPSLMDRPDQARAVAARQDIAALTQALKLYRLDNGRYPSTAQGLAALHQRPSQPPEPRNWRSYMDRLPMTLGAIPISICNPAFRARSMCSPWGRTGRPAGPAVTRT